LTLNPQLFADIELKFGEKQSLGGVRKSRFSGKFKMADIFVLFLALNVQTLLA